MPLVYRLIGLPGLCSLLSGNSYVASLHRWLSAYFLALAGLHVAQAEPMWAESV